MFLIARRVAKASLLVAGVFALNAPAIGQDETPKLYDLRLKAPKGTTVWFVETTTYDQEHETRPKEIVLVNRTFGITIKQIDTKGNRIVEIHVARIDGLRRKGDTNVTAFDSNDLDKTGKLHPWMSHLMTAAGQRYIVRIDVNGKLAGSMDGVTHEMQAKDPKAQVWASALADLAETAFGRTPNNPMAIGGTWKIVQSGTDAMQHFARHATTLTLAKVTESAFEMALTGTVEQNKTPAGSRNEAPNSYEAQHAQTQERMGISNGKLTGKLVLSRQDGLISDTELKATFDMDMTAFGLKDNIKMTMTTKLTRTTKPSIKPRKQKLPEATLAERTAKSQINAKLLANAVRMYYTKNSKLPESLAVLAERDERGRSEILELPKDSWGHPYKLVKGDTPREFQVISAGPDNKHGTEDDISNRTKRR